MSELPVIDSTRVTKKFMSELSELTYQKFQLEVLAEALRDERDKAVQECNALRAELLRRATGSPTGVATALDGDGDAPPVTPSDEVHTITTVDESAP